MDSLYMNKLSWQNGGAKSDVINKCHWVKWISMWEKIIVGPVEENYMSSLLTILSLSWPQLPCGQNVWYFLNDFHLGHVGCFNHWNEDSLSLSGRMRII